MILFIVVAFTVGMLVGAIAIEWAYNISGPKGHDFYD